MTEKYKQERWSLDALFPGHDTPELKGAMEKLEQDTTKFEEYRSQLTDDIDEKTFENILVDLEEITKQAIRLGGYSFLWFSEDTQDQDAIAFQGKIQQYIAGLQNKTLFFSIWWKKLDQEIADKLMKTAGDLEYWLEEIRHYTPFTLTEPEEKIINIKNVTGPTALYSLYESITNSYSYKVTVEGEEKELTRGELMVYARHHDPDLRKAIYQELYRVYGNEGPILGQIYQIKVRDWYNEYIDMRSYKSPMSLLPRVNPIKNTPINKLWICAWMLSKLLIHV